MPVTRTQKIVAFSIGLVFMLSGIGKALNVFLFQMLIHSYGFPYLDLLAPVIVLAELVLAFLFIVRERVKTLSLCSIVLLLLFTAVYTFGYTRQGVTDCGCFGVIRMPDVSPVYVYIRNIVLIGALNYLYFTAEDEPAVWNTRRRLVFATYLVLLLFWAGMTFRPLAFLPSAEHPYTGRAIAETPLAEQVPQAESVLVLCYSYQCSHCMNTMENYFAMQRYHRVDTIVAVAVVRDLNERDSLGQQLLTRYPQLGERTVLASAVPEIKELPTSLLVEKDTIRQVIAGELPNPYLIETIKTKQSTYENL